MSRSRKDQRGGHRCHKSSTYSCGCCAILVPSHQSHNRTERERESQRYEAAALDSCDTPAPTHQKVNTR